MAVTHKKQHGFGMELLHDPEGGNHFRDMATFEKTAEEADQAFIGKTEFDFEIHHCLLGGGSKTIGYSRVNRLSGCLMLDFLF